MPIEVGVTCSCAITLGPWWTYIKTPLDILVDARRIWRLGLHTGVGEGTQGYLQIHSGGLSQWLTSMGAACRGQKLGRTCTIHHKITRR